MQEKTMLKVALVLTVIGLLALYFIADLSKIGELDLTDEAQLNANIDKTVKVKGKIVGYKDYGKTAIVRIEQPDEIEVLLFKEGNISIPEGEFVSVTGEVKEYADRFEIVADSIESVD